MKNIGGNLNFEGRAVYLHGVLGLDRRTRIYVGQSGSLRARLKQHWNFRHRRDNPSLHYHAMQNSIYDVFAVLATLPVLLEIPGMDRPDLFLNVLETWCCLLFRSLPPQVIAEYIPLGAVEEKENESGALNIANPLDHGGDSTWECPHLKESRDPLVLDYVRELERKATPDIQFVEVKATPEICYVEIEKPAPPGVQPATLLFIGAAAFAGFMLFRRISGPK